MSENAPGRYGTFAVNSYYVAHTAKVVSLPNANRGEWSHNLRFRRCGAIPGFIVCCFNLLCHWSRRHRARRGARWFGCRLYMDGSPHSVNPRL